MCPKLSLPSVPIAFKVSCMNTPHSPVILMCVEWWLGLLWLYGTVTIKENTRRKSAAGVSSCWDSTVCSLTSIFSNVNCDQTTQKEFCVPLRQNRVTDECTRTHLCVCLCVYIGVLVYVCMFELWLSDFSDYGIRPQMSRTDPKSNTHRRSLTSHTHAHTQSLPGQAVSA